MKRTACRRTLTSDFNVFSGVDNFHWSEGGTVFKNQSFAQWTAATGHDQNSTLCQPTLVSVGDFHLSGSDTCALDQGIALAEVPVDIDGDERPSGAAYDVGADEYVSSSASLAKSSGDVPDNTGKTNNGEHPNRFALAQNYPNPFNPVTQIEYALPQSSHVRLVVYDVFGQVVTTLVDRQQSPGHYQVRFDAGDLATGTYFYRIHAGEQVITKRMVLVK